ncbi:MAG TPA: DUF4062 domain-containing protein [Saprospiraceae bacterium]
MSIRTPDQRVRVFISSTIQELAEERKAAREAIESLHLIPVFFEAGARPHPPRELYRAYLDQSHIFVGIYWNKYGWVAPGMTISGLEDEFVLSIGKPRLIYIKNTTDAREPGMVSLLKKIEEGGAACFQKFSSTEELSELLQSDLSLLLSEKFQANDEPLQHVSEDKRTPLPSDRVVLIGREAETQSVIDMLLKKDVSLVTLTGAGGTGKTRLGIHTANLVASHFPDGVFYVPLSTLQDKEAFIPFITKHIGFYDGGKRELKEGLFQYLSDKKCLLLLDNFEQIVSASVDLAELLSYCSHMKVLVTSRTPLRISAENVFPLLPLSVEEIPNEGHAASAEQIPAVKLFIQRAKEINPAFHPDKENMEAILNICKKLNGIPLAIELAAARTRLLTPVALAGRMSNMLDTLVHGKQDAPDRHRTLRATIEWSYNLLDDSAKTIFRRLAVLSGYWPIEDAEAVTNWEHYDILSIIEKLLDVSLVQCQYQDGDNAFSMFEAVREYAFEQLKLRNETDEIWKSHLHYHVKLVDEIRPFTWSSQRVSWFKRLERESHHIRDAFQFAVRTGDYVSAWDIVQGLGFYWAFHGKVTEGIQLIELAKVSLKESENGTFRQTIPLDIQAGAFRTSGMVRFFEGAYHQGIDELKESVRIYQQLNNEIDAGRALSYLAIASISTGDPNSRKYFEDAIAIALKHDDKHNLIISSTFLAEVLNAFNESEQAVELATRAIDISRDHGDAMLTALALGQAGNVYVVVGNFDLAEKAYRECLDLARIAPLGSLQGWFEIGLGYCRFLQGDLEEAKKYLVIGTLTSRRAADYAITLSALFGFSLVAAMESKFERAARLYGAADAMHERSGYTLWNSSRKVRKALDEKFSNHPDQAMIIREKDAGYKMPVEEILTYAMQIA